jgi:formylglycine-generating enzyme
MARGRPAATRLIAAAAGAVLLAAACRGTPPPPEPPPGMVLVPGGRFTMGTDDGLPIEGPAHQVEVAAFFLDLEEVSNRAFAGFVADTGYQSEAEKIGWALVFDLEERSWTPVKGADWRHPEGPGSTITGREDHPVVQVSWADAQAFARWAGKRLPTEAEWERAARGGIEGARYPWGDELAPSGRHRANLWQGPFPADNQGLDGFVTTAPVASFPPNGYGLHDMAGNVWEWTADWLEPYRPPEPGARAASGSAARQRVIRGGSWMCSEDFCTGYRVAARQGSDPDSALNNLGFRCARDLP